MKILRVHVGVPGEVFPFVHLEAVHFLGEEKHLADAGFVGGEFVELAFDVEGELGGLGVGRVLADAVRYLVFSAGKFISQ